MDGCARKKPLSPPLSPDESAWLEQQLRARQGQANPDPGSRSATHDCLSACRAYCPSSTENEDLVLKVAGPGSELSS